MLKPIKNYERYLIDPENGNIYSNAKGKKMFLLKTYTDSFMVKNWTESFVTLTLSNFPSLFIDSLKFMFAPVKMLLCLLIFFMCGIIYFIRERNQKSIILFLTIIFILKTGNGHIIKMQIRCMWNSLKDFLSRKKKNKKC